MISRYENPVIRDIFSQKNTIQMWRDIEIQYLEARCVTGDPLVTREVLRQARCATTPTPEDVAECERVHGHDVVAFLAAWTADMPDEAASQVHAGLTSSDLVDNALFMQIREASIWITKGLAQLNDKLIELRRRYQDTPRISRTHGQHAEVGDFSWRFAVWQNTLSDLRGIGYAAAHDAVTVFKTTGVDGQMTILGQDVALLVSSSVHRRLVPSTQVIPRQRLITWAGWMVAVASLMEEIALEIRLSARTEVEELQEGAASRRAGSSAMPHKKNPIQSERVSGLGRVARSNFGAIAETAGNLHNERDISNSSVERIVVPDTCHLVAFMVAEMLEVLSDLQVNTQLMKARADAHDGSAWQMFDLQKEGIRYMDARDRATL
jgi:adenylosuccinate lyase